MRILCSRYIGITIMLCDSNAAKCDVVKVHSSRLRYFFTEIFLFCAVCNICVGAVIKYSAIFNVN
jgi:hypothetical protein